MVLTLKNDNFRYVETFQLVPPSLQVGLPLPEDTVSQIQGYIRYFNALLVPPVIQAFRASPLIQS